MCPSWTRTNISTSDRNRPERFAVTIETDKLDEIAEYKARRRTQLATTALDVEISTTHSSFVRPVADTGRCVMLDKPEAAKVIPDIHDRGLSVKPVPTVYLPYRQFALAYGL